MPYLPPERERRPPIAPAPTPQERTGGLLGAIGEFIRPAAGAEQQLQQREYFAQRQEEAKRGREFEAAREDEIIGPALQADVVRRAVASGMMKEPEAREAAAATTMREYKLMGQGRYGVPTGKQPDLPEAIRKEISTAGTLVPREAPNREILVKGKAYDALAISQYAPMMPGVAWLRAELDDPEMDRAKAVTFIRDLPNAKNWGAYTQIDPRLEEYRRYLAALMETPRRADMPWVPSWAEFLLQPLREEPPPEIAHPALKPAAREKSPIRPEVKAGVKRAIQAVRVVGGR